MLRALRAAHACVPRARVLCAARTLSTDANFQANAAATSSVLDAFRERQAAVLRGGSEKAVQLHRSRGKLLVRERVEVLLDPGSPFLELSMLAGWTLDGKNKHPAAGIVTGVGSVSGRPCMIVANDPTVKGGTYTPLTIKKHLRAQRIAFENRLPCLYLVESGGGDLTTDPGSGAFGDETGFGRIFYNQAKMSAQGIPQVAIVLGSCTAGGAYVPAMADEVVIVRGNGTIFLAGPPLVRAATGEVVTAEELGGGELHCRTSGVADHLADDEPHALRIARTIVGSLPPPPVPPDGGAKQRAPAAPPRHPIDELHGLIPADPKQPMDMRAILARLVDHSELHEFKAEFGVTLVTGFARIEGHEVGIVANDGVLHSDSSVKGAHFVELCCQRGVPLLFLQNITGFMVGRDAEAGGIAKHGAKLVHAVANAAVPKLTLVVGGSFGAGNYGMCGRAYAPRFMFMWPTARIGVMGGEQAAGMLTQVRAAAAKRAGIAMDEAQTAAFYEETKKRMDDASSSTYASSLLWDDGIVEPMQTRQTLALALDIVRGGETSATKFGVFRM